MNSVQTNSDLMDYRINVEKMFDLNSETMVNNSCIEHAQVLIETLINRSEKSLVFLCKDLKPEFYDDNTMIKYFQDAIERGVKIRIMTQQPIQSTELIKLLKNKEIKQDHLEIKECLTDSKLGRANLNFVVMDSKAFRFEYDLKNHIATASANRPDLASSMEKLFSNFWDEARSVSL